jgi:hypothetical protein
MKNKLDKRLSAISDYIQIKLLEIERFAGQFSAGAAYVPDMLNRLKKNCTYNLDWCINTY